MKYKYNSVSDANMDKTRIIMEKAIEYTSDMLKSLEISESISECANDDPADFSITFSNDLESFNYIHDKDVGHKSPYTAVDQDNIWVSVDQIKRVCLKYPGYLEGIKFALRSMGKQDGDEILTEYMAIQLSNEMMRFITY